ncbi:hypothetical protein Dimus_039327 [Dionaea muscipula]
MIKNIKGGLSQLGHGKQHVLRKQPNVCDGDSNTTHIFPRRKKLLANATSTENDIGIVATRGDKGLHSFIGTKPNTSISRKQPPIGCDGKPKTNTNLVSMRHTASGSTLHTYKLAFYCFSGVSLCHLCWPFFSLLLLLAFFLSFVDFTCPSLM